jgi:hypothetical protein
MPARFANEFAFSIFSTREVHAFGANFSRAAIFLTHSHSRPHPHPHRQPRTKLRMKDEDDDEDDFERITARRNLASPCDLFSQPKRGGVCT